MYLPIFVLSATWMTAAPPPAQPDPGFQPPVLAAQAPAVPSPVESPPPPSPTLRERIRNFFSPHHDQPDNPPPAAASFQPRVLDRTPIAPVPTGTPMPQAAIGTPMPPVTTVSPMAPVVTSTAGQAVPKNPTPAARPDLQLSEKDLARVGHEQDYSWITGKLFRAQGSNGFVLRYTAPYEEDTYGGAVLLTPPAKLADMHEGDLVCVRGKVIGTGRAARPHAGAVYQVDMASVIERAAH